MQESLMRNQSPGAHDLHSVNSIRSASISSLDVQDDSVTRQHETSKAADDAGHPLWDFGNVLKAFIGSNYLSMPFSLRTAGLWAGLLGLAIIAVVTRSGCALLVKVKRVQEKKYGVHTYGDLVSCTFGDNGRRVVDTLLITTQFGFCVGYMIFMGSTLSELTDLTHAESIFIFTPFIMLLALIRTIHWLKPFSMFANIALFIGFITVLSVEISKDKHDGTKSIQGFRPSGFPVFFGLVTSSYEGIGTVLPIEESVKRRDVFYKLLDASLLTVTLILGSFGVMGFLTYGEQVHDIIILDLPNNHGTDVLKVCLIIGVLFTYPLQILPVSRIAEKYLLQRRTSAHPSVAVDQADTVDSEFGDDLSDVHPVGGHSGGYSRVPVADTALQPVAVSERCVEHPLLVRNLLRIGIVFLTGLIAVAVPSFHLIISLVGSLGGAGLAFVFPALLSLKVFKTEGWEKARDIFMVVFGICGAVVGTVISMKKIVE